MENEEFNALVRFQRRTLSAFASSVVSAHFYREDVPVFHPMHDNPKGYNLIADIDGRLIRIQVKVASSQGQVTMSTEKRRWSDESSRVVADDENSFDILACVDRESMKVYLYAPNEIDFSRSRFMLDRSEARNVHNLVLKNRIG